MGTTMMSWSPSVTYRGEPAETIAASTQSPAPSPSPSTAAGNSEREEYNGENALSVTSRPELIPGMRAKIVNGSGERREVILVCHVGEQTSNGLRRASVWRVRCLDGSGDIVEVNDDKLELIPHLSMAPRSSHTSPKIQGGTSFCTEGSFQDFIRADSNESLPAGQSRQRIWLRQVLNDSKTEGVVGGVILFNFALICLVTDSEADYPGRSADSAAHGISKATLDSLMFGCFLFFVAELIARIIADQREFLKFAVNWLDIAIIAMGAIEYTIIVFFDQGLSGFGVIRTARLVRLVRLVRVMRLFTVLKELRRLIQMMGSCFKTLFWSFLLLMLVMTIFAVIAVELVNPVVQTLADQGSWDDCERCRRSFASTFMANLTFFQTVVAGDSWGYIAVPVIEEYPWTALVFVGALLTLVFGVLNLIVAVIVDTFAENRDNDISSKALELEAREQEEKNSLFKMFRHIDLDGDGILSLDEIKDGARRVADFRHLLRVMDIDKSDLRQLFSIIDEDGNGEIDCTEFIEVMWRMKNADPKTATKFLKYMLHKLDNEAKGIHADLTLSMASLSTTLGRAVQELGRYHDEKSRKRIGTTAEMLTSLGGMLQESMPQELKSHLEARREQLLSGDGAQKITSQPHFILPPRDTEFNSDGSETGTYAVGTVENLAPYPSSWHSEEDLMRDLQEHERVIHETVASAVNKVTVEALDQAMKAAAEAARGVLMQAAHSSQGWAADILDDANQRLPEIPRTKKLQKDFGFKHSSPGSEKDEVMSQTSTDPRQLDVIIDKVSSGIEEVGAACLHGCNPTPQSGGPCTPTVAPLPLQRDEQIRAGTAPKKTVPTSLNSLNSLNSSLHSLQSLQSLQSVHSPSSSGPPSPKRAKTPKFDTFASSSAALARVLSNKTSSSLPSQQERPTRPSSKGLNLSAFAVPPVAASTSVTSESNLTVAAPPSPGRSTALSPRSNSSRSNLSPLSPSRQHFPSSFL